MGNEKPDSQGAFPGFTEPTPEAPAPDPKTASTEGDQSYLGEFKTREEAERAWDERQRDLQAREERILELERTNATLLDRAVSAPRTPEPAPEPLGDMPDPAEDPKAFKGWMDRREAIRKQEDDDRRKAAEAATAEREKRASLWADFQREYPDLAKYPDDVQTAFVRELGGEVQRLPADLDGLRKRVAARVQKKFDDIRGGVDGGSGGANRTGGVSSSSTPAPGRTPTPTPPDSVHFVDELLDLQGKSEFI